MLEVKNVSKEFDKKISKKETIKFLADNDISFTANEGEIVGIVGPNGAGKTTSIGKIANNLKNQGKKVLVVAADTFRAAAVEQLQVWAQRANVDIINSLFCCSLITDSILSKISSSLLQ